MARGEETASSRKRRRHCRLAPRHQLATQVILVSFALAEISAAAFVSQHQPQSHRPAFRFRRRQSSTTSIRTATRSAGNGSGRSDAFIQHRKHIDVGRHRISSSFDTSLRAVQVSDRNSENDDTSNGRSIADDSQQQQPSAEDAKDRAMAALSNPGGLPANDPPLDASDAISTSETNADASSSSNTVEESEGDLGEPSGSSSSSSILPPLPGYDNEKKKTGSSGRRKRRPHVKMKRRSGGRKSDQQKPSSFSSSVSTPSSLLPPPPPSSGGPGAGDDWNGRVDWERDGTNKRNNRNVRSSSASNSKRSGDRSQNASASASLLPPLSEGDESPLDWGDWFRGEKSGAGDDDDEGRRSSESSPASSSSSSFSLLPDLPPIPGSSESPSGVGRESGTFSRPISPHDLPSVSDLFAPSASPKASKETQSKEGGRERRDGKDKAGESQSSMPTSEPTVAGSALEGVIPVSELFYRSTQALSADDDGIGTNDAARLGGDDDATHDDEELPFSIEQSDTLTTDGNKIRIRRNQAGIAQNKKGGISSPSSRRTRGRRGRRASQGGSGPGRGRARQQQRSKGRRKMIRRGMEMLVGGEPINADPPLRCMELYYERGSGSDGVRTNVVQNIVSDDSSSETPTAGTAGPIDWANAITSSSRDFGPLLYSPSVPLVSDVSRGLYCEHFVNSALKWKICPKDLRDIVKVHDLSRQQKKRQQKMSAQESNESPPPSTTTAAGHDVSDLHLSEVAYDSLLSDVDNMKGPSPLKLLTDGGIGVGRYSTKENEADDEALHNEGDVEAGSVSSPDALTSESDADSAVAKSNTQPKKKRLGFASGAGFGSSSQKRQEKNDKDGGADSETKHLSPPSSFRSVQSVHTEEDTASSEGAAMNRAARRKKSPSGGSSNQEKIVNICLSGELKFVIGVSRTELESGRNGGSGGHILRRVLSKGIASAIKADDLKVDVRVAKMILTEVDGGSTDVDVEFLMTARPRYGDEVERRQNQINAALAKVMDDGDMSVAMAAASKEEKAWPSKVRDRVVEEFLFEEDDENADVEANEEEKEGEFVYSDAASDERGKTLAEGGKDTIKDNGAYDGPFGMPGDTIYASDDIYLGGGNGGVFYDYSELGSSNAPFKGELGPLLVDAATQRAIQRHPRVIAIGDVHGCLDELQMLLRRCDYQPGDLVVFLGDLVSKGPDSLSVVQMAREIGSIGVRGNHDFEVIRWHQAMKSGADPPVIGSEHFHIASGLSKADLKWMYSLPWYISSKELGALFVHAGFVSGIRLSKQNPRLMMNMRSILPDGTVTSKFFNNWPWARLWDGPQTVLFGHDADRGLQQYEHAIGLDTGCVYGGRLTACILPEKRLVSVSAKREYFQYRRKHFD